MSKKKRPGKAGASRKATSQRRAAKAGRATTKGKNAAAEDGNVEPDREANEESALALLLRGGPGHGGEPIEQEDAWKSPPCDGTDLDANRWWLWFIQRIPADRLEITDEHRQRYRRSIWTFLLYSGPRRDSSWHQLETLFRAHVPECIEKNECTYRDRRFGKIVEANC